MSNDKTLTVRIRPECHDLLQDLQRIYRSPTLQLTVERLIRADADRLKADGLWPWDDATKRQSAAATKSGAKRRKGKR